MRSQFLARFASAPALVAADMQERFEACLMSVDREWGQYQERDAASVAVMQDDFWFAADDWRAAYRPYVVKAGILLIPVKGVLLHDFPFAFGSFATGYEYIWKAFDRGMSDFNVQGIALVCDSPGGEVAGNFDLVDKMFERRGEKPVRSYAAESAYSAAYSIASVGEQLTVSRTGGVGSIGVVTMHVDMSKRLDDIGYAITFIHAGKHKVDGNAFAPLPDDVKARIQVRINALYDVFVAIVARNRGMEEAAVRATEALTYSASEAVSINLADDIGALEGALAAFAADLSLPDGEEDMSTKDNSAADQAAIDTARATARTEGEAAGRAEGLKTGGSEMQARCKAILGSDEAKGREDLANHLAFDTDMSAEAAVALLGKAPKAAAPTTASDGNRFDAAMNAAGNPVVGPDGGLATAQSEEEVEAKAIVASFRPNRAA